MRNLPPPVQAHLPICIGGGGEQVTLKLVARYADMNNVGGGIENVRRKEEVLLRHCETVGRDPSEIERTTGIGTVFIRDDRGRGGAAVPAAIRPQRRGRALGRPAGRDGGGRRRVPRAVRGARLPAPHRRLPAPYDEESMTRFATEVRPLLEQL